MSSDDTRSLGNGEQFVIRLFVPQDFSTRTEEGWLLPHRIRDEGV
jgi:hypothetical protein